LQKLNEYGIIRVVIATGIASVVTQLMMIREFLTRFQGNEIVIALILFNWLILGGLGTLLARIITRRVWKATVTRLAWLSLILCALSPLQILCVRKLRDIVFVYGSSVGFYATWLFTIANLVPYCLLLGFVLPYSLFVLRTEVPDYPGTRIYITDNIGDIGGGALFSFVLVYLVTPLQAIFWAHLPLLAAIYFIYPNGNKKSFVFFFAGAVVFFILGSAVLLEKASLAPPEGQLVHYRETRYGRITVHQDQDQFTLFEDGIPVFSTENLAMAEETIHYPLAQLDRLERVLLISAQGGVMAELKKYHLASVDYVELDPEVTNVQFRFGMLEDIPGLNVIHEDGRVYLTKTPKLYDAIIVNLPEPDTFQINRFYTDRFFELARQRLASTGVLCFSMGGFDNYLAEPQRQKLSSLYNTATVYFKHVLLLPGHKVFFLCSDSALTSAIPSALETKGIATAYISGFYDGNLTQERIDYLNQRMDSKTPKNFDTAPHLMRLMFSEWFAKYQTSPMAFFLVLALLSLIYVMRISREEFVLFSSGCASMGSEILIIFAFQIYFGYIYLQIGIIITVFLAGLLPGAWLGNHLSRYGERILAVTDGCLIILLGGFILCLLGFGDRLPVSFYLIFGFAVSMVCGMQFPVALHLRGDDNSAASRTFSADLVGAACGVLLTSIILIPYIGILWAAAGLIGLKLISSGTTFFHRFQSS
jgi:spermidine synthase